MEKNFSFDTVGKRMPYAMPENFLHDMQHAVEQRISGMKTETTRRKAARMRIMFHSAVSAAAAVTLFLVCYNTMLRPKPAGSYADIERAFDNLSSDDQAYMLDTYSTDAFAYADEGGEY